MSNQELALELKSINRQQHRLVRALQDAERKQAKPKTRKVINYPKAFFMVNVLFGLGFIVTNAIAKFAFLMK